MTQVRHKFFYPLQVRFADTDAQGHVFFGAYFTYFDEGLMAYMRHLGFPWKTLLEMGIETIYVDAHCQFNLPATVEESLHVHTRISRIGNSSFTSEFVIYKEEGHDVLVARGHLTAVAVDSKSRRPVRVPEPIRAAVADYEGVTGY
jgi:acyl-CoA thioester hydrolase